jgi:opacity protein-like surface antigen
MRLAFTALLAFALAAAFASADAVPNVTLVTPIDGASVAEGVVTFDCLGFDDVGLNSLALLGNWSGKTEVVETRFKPANNTAQHFTVTLGRGVFSWDCLAADSASQSAFANNSFTISAVRRVFAATPVPQVFNRISLDCPPASLNASAVITVSNYKQNALSCTGFGITASYANGSALPQDALLDRGCQGGRPRYDLRFPGSGDYVVNAQGSEPGVNASCAITFRGLPGRQSRRVPDFNPLLAPFFALAALLLVRRFERK